VLAATLGAGRRGASATDRLCRVFVPLLGVDAAAISLIDEGMSRGTFGSSEKAAKVLDEVQFTCGEGPCLEAARNKTPVFAPDLQDRDEVRWSAFRDAAQRAGIRAVFAIPIRVDNAGLDGDRPIPSNAGTAVDDPDS
jgi:hypothetical protein